MRPRQCFAQEAHEVPVHDIRHVRVTVAARLEDRRKALQIGDRIQIHRRLLEPETAAVYGEDRVQLEGPNIRVNAQATLAIGMAIHELATNAAKYGAFSVENGHVHVRWSRLNDARGDRLILTWKESGGPRPDAPEAKGFGSQLIRAAIEANLGGTTTSAWEEDGLRFDMEVDFEDVTNIGDSDFLSHEKIQKAIGRQGAAPS